MIKKILIMVLAISLVSIIVPKISSAAEASSWIENIKLSGDLRIRMEYYETKPGAHNERQRVRLRMGADTTINDEVKMMFGFASGSSDMPTSTNQDMGGEFASWPIWLDYAYASYAPYEDVQLLAGKMKNPYQCSDLTWGADVRPEGIAVNVTSNIMEDMNTALKLTLGYFNVYNSATGSNEDINLFAPQIGATTKFDNDYTLDLAVAMYTFDNYKGTSAATLQEDRGGNTTSGGLIANDFSVLNPMIKLDAPSVLDAIDIPFGVYAEMLENSEADDNSSGYRIGLRIGMAKLKEVNDWNFVYELSRLEADAFPDAFGDASWGPIGTDTKGSKLSLSYQLAKNFGIGLTYFDLSKISADSDKTIGQLDFNVKF